jgi:hypothetical protein
MLFLPFALIFMIGGIWFYWQIKNQPDYQNEGNNTKYLFKKRKRLKRKLGIIKYRLIKKWNARNHFFQITYFNKIKKNIVKASIFANKKLKFNYKSTGNFIMQ